MRFIFIVLLSILLCILPVLSSSGFYDIDEVRSTLYEPDISSVLAGIDPSFNLSTVSLQNKDSILEKILSDLPTVGDKEYVFIKSRKGQNFACKIPKVQAPEKVQSESYNPKYLAELVSASFYVKNCISKDNGWWNYKLCRGKDVKQWHGAKNEAQQVTNSLGFFLGKYDVPEYQTSTTERLMYLEEHYEGGTLCDLPDKKSPRKTAVRYECDPQLSTSEAYIDHVEESASCEYVITVKVGSLCSLSAFMPPNLIKPNKIACQPFVSKEAIEKFLVETIRKRAAKKEAVVRARELLDTLHRIQRRRAALRRTELLRDSSVEKSALRSYVDNEYHTVAWEYIRATLHGRLGDVPPDGISDTVDTLTREIDDINDIFYNFDYMSERDQDAGNLWYYFHDRSWNKTHFPKSLDYVDIMNGYYNAASKLLKNHPDVALALRMFKFLRGNPWNPNENLLLHGGLGNNLRSAVLQDIPLFVAPNGEDTLDEEFARNVGYGNGLFGFRAASVVNAFMTQVRAGFANGIELVHADEKLENALGTQLVPAYKYIELLLLEDRTSVPEEMRRNLENDMARMLDRLCVAYELSQIRFDAEHPGHALSFAGVGSGKKSNVLFDDYYQSVVKKRSEEVQAEIENRLRQEMTSLLEQYSVQVFHEQWFTMSEMLLYKKREEDALKHGKNSRDQLKSLFIDGKVVLANTDFKEVLSLLNTAGLQVEDMKMEVVTTNVMGGPPQKFTSEELRLLQEVIKRQMEDLRDMKRISQREQAYGNLVE
nr:Glucosidase II beta subunit domain containing protein [Haemonchus contortus]